MLELTWQDNCDASEIHKNSQPQKGTKAQNINHSIQIFFCAFLWLLIVAQVEALNVVCFSGGFINVQHGGADPHLPR